MTVQPQSLDPAHIPFPKKIIALCGDRKQIHSLVLQSLCLRAARGERLALVIGDNHFDAYRLARLARTHGFDPAVLLSCLELSRPFTCHQLHHRIASLAATRPYPYRALYVLGLLETFYDEDIRAYDAQRLAQKTLAHLKTIAAYGLPVLVTIALPKQRGREHFVEIVKRAADAYWQPAPVVLAQVNAQQLSFAEMF